MNMENNKFQGKRAEIGVYDDWIHGDDGVEFIVSSPKILHDKITAEQHSKILEKLDSFTINIEYKQASMQEIIDKIIKQLEKAND